MRIVCEIEVDFMRKEGVREKRRKKLKKTEKTLRKGLDKGRGK